MPSSYHRLAACARRMGRRASILFVTGHAARRSAEAPLVLAKTGWLYVGGHVVTIAGKHYMVGQMYAEYLIPAKQLHPYPVIMVHGGTMSGTNYTGTPDGREGWAQNFVRAGYAVYVVDQVGKGRSPYYPEIYGPNSPTALSNNQSPYVAQDVPVALAPFGQIDSGLSRQYEGTGLGLPLSKALIDPHKGNLKIETALGRDTTVTISLPKRTVHDNAAAVAA
ncbi:MAG TPA: ATP-binding protein [Stellaceae bacterium]|nr:ATP-binding protein [Stellaceae bacterium]